MFVAIDFFEEKFFFGHESSTFELETFDFAIATFNLRFIRNCDNSGFDGPMHSRHGLRWNNDFRNVQWFQWFISFIIGFGT